MGQLLHDSKGSHFMSPQYGLQAPQSTGQVVQVSPWRKSHTLSPQVGLHAPQSAGQLLHDSLVGSHLPSPHVGGQGPQSPGQVLHVSPAWASHFLSPHVLAPQPPHAVEVQALTQMASQAFLQQ